MSAIIFVNGLDYYLIEIFERFEFLGYESLQDLLLSTLILHMPRLYSVWTFLIYLIPLPHSHIHSGVSIQLAVENIICSGKRQLGGWKIFGLGALHTFIP
jgi:hypothetical protein